MTQFNGSKAVTGGNNEHSQLRQTLQYANSYKNHLANNAAFLLWQSMVNTSQPYGGKAVV